MDNLSSPPSPHDALISPLMESISSFSSTGIIMNPLDSPGGHAMMHMSSSTLSSSEDERESDLSKSSDPQRRYYEVYFTCFVGTYWTSKYQLSEGDFIIVQADRGHDIGVVNHALHSNEIPIHQSTDESNEIISVVPKDEFPVRAMLQDKVIAQNQALEICRNKCVELLISSQIEVIATEFQFDRKKLTLYYKKHSDVSVCKLIRKLYNIFKMRIWMEPIDVELSNDSFGNITTKFLSLGQITIPPQEKTVTNSSEYLPSFVSSNSTATETTASLSVSSTSLPKKENDDPIFVEKLGRSSPIQAPKQYSILSHEKLGSPIKAVNPARQVFQQTAAPHPAIQPPQQYYRHHQYQPRPQHQTRGAPSGYAYSVPMSKARGPAIAPTLGNLNQHYDYERNYIRDPSLNYRDQYATSAIYDYDVPAPHQSSYRHDSIPQSVRQERLDHYGDMIGAGPSAVGLSLDEDPYYQHQQSSRNHYAKYASTGDGNHHHHYLSSAANHSSSISYQNEDSGRFLTNGLYEDESVMMSSPSRESAYEYSNFMPQSKSFGGAYDYHTQF